MSPRGSPRQSLSLTCLSQASTINPSDPMTKPVCKPTGYASDAGSVGSTGSTPHAPPQGGFGGGGMQTNALYDSSPPPRPAGLRFPGPQQPDGAASPAGRGFAPSPGMRPPAVSPMVRSSRSIRQRQTAYGTASCICVPMTEHHLHTCRAVHMVALAI